MKLSKSRLQQIIKEELRVILEQVTPQEQLKEQTEADCAKKHRRGGAAYAACVRKLAGYQGQPGGGAPKAPAKAGTKQLPPVPPQKGAAIPQTKAGPLGKSKKGLDPKYMPGWDDGKSKYKRGPRLGRGTLRRGHRGKGVEHLQKLLHKAGFKGFTAEDGLFGPKTHKAVEKFQQMNNLKVDGLVGKNTAKEMLRATGGMTAPQAKSHIGKKATIRKQAMQGDYDGDGVPDAMQARKPGGFQGRGPGPWKNR